MADYRSVVSINSNTQIPYLALVNEQGGTIAVPANYNVNYIDTLGGGKLMDWNYYPLEDYKHNVTKTNTEEILANLGLQYNIVKGINVNILYQYGKQRKEADMASDTSSYYARNLINSFSQIDRTMGIVNYIIPLGGILNKSFNNLYSYNLRGQINAGKRFGNHQFNAIAGMEIRNSSTSGSSSI